MILSFTRRPASLPATDRSPRPAPALIRELARRRLWRLALGFAALVGVDLLQLYVPRLMKLAVDGLTRGEATGAFLLHIALLVVALSAGMGLLRLVWRPLLLGFSRHVETELRGKLYAHLQGMHLGYFNDNPPGELMARATNDLNNIRMASGMGLVAGVDGVVMGLCALGFMAYISPVLTALAVLPLPLIVVVTRLQTKKMHRGYLDVQESFSAMTELVREGLSGIRLIKAYGLLGRELARLATAGRGHLDMNMSLARLLGFFFPLMVLFTNLSLAVVMGVGGPLAVFGRITAGDYVAFSVYLGMLAWPMMALGWVVSLMQRAKGSLGRVDAVLSRQPLVVEHPSPRRRTASGPPELTVRGLSFSHPGAMAPALHDVNLTVPAGGSCALVGPIASGKTTLTSLVTRLIEPPPGTVLLDGVDVRELALADLRRTVLAVPQEAFVFSATLRRNLSLGQEGFDDEAMWRALTAADLDGDVRGLEDGLDTMLGEQGASLSGGQRQRLALARALLRDPPFLILDDPLAAVDTETEKRIISRLAGLRSGRTTLMVSHRLGSVAFADCIHVLERGRLVQSGCHRELMEREGLYRELFAEQALMAELEGEDAAV